MGARTRAVHNAGTKVVVQWSRCVESKDFSRMLCLTAGSVLEALPSRSTHCTPDRSSWQKLQQQRQRGQQRPRCCFQKQCLRRAVVPAANKQRRAVGRCRCSHQEPDPATPSATSAPLRVAPQTPAIANIAAVAVAAISALVAQPAGAATAEVEVDGSAGTERRARHWNVER